MIDYTIDDIPVDMAKEAVFAIDPGACNLSGLAHSLSRATTKLWEFCHEKQKGGTDWVNGHPYITLMLAQMVWLNHSGSIDMDVYSKAEELCRAAIAAAIVRPIDQKAGLTRAS